MSMHRVRVAGDIKFLEATDSKKPVAYARLVEDRQKRGPDGSWVDDDPNWYEGTFKGGWAVALRDGYQSGDPLIVFGDTEREMREVDGKTYRSTRLYVNGFGPDAILARINLDRTPRTRQGQDAAPAQSVDQGLDADTEGEPQAAKTSLPSRDETLEELERRARALLEAGRLSQFQFEQLGNASLTAAPEIWQERLHSVCVGTDLPRAETVYLVSVVDEHAGTGEKLDWEQAETLANAEAQHTRTEPPAPPVSAPAAAPRM